MDHHAGGSPHRRAEAATLWRTSRVRLPRSRRTARRRHRKRSPAAVRTPLPTPLSWPHHVPRPSTTHLVHSVSGRSVRVHNNETGPLVAPDQKEATISRKHAPARLPGQTIPCGWCRAPIAVRATGRLPKWCSPSCRQRAWQQRRAAASGLAAVDVVDRFIEVEKEVTVVEYVHVTVPPRGAAWPAALTELAKQIDTGRLYDRDLRALAQSLDEVLHALARRPAWRRLRP